MPHGLKKEKGFIRNHQHKRNNYYYNTHTSANIFDTHKALKHKKVKKRSGWSKGLNAKQFDVSRRNYCKHFNTRKSVADLVTLPQICWGFAHHLTLGGNQKFSFKP